MPGETREQIALLDAAVGQLRDPLLLRLKEVCSELISLHREVSQLMSQSKEGKTRAYYDANESTNSGREHFADYTTIGLQTEIIRANGEIAAFQEERDFLRDLLKERREHQDTRTASHES